MFRMVRGNRTISCHPKDLEKLKNEVPELVMVVCNLLLTCLRNYVAANVMPFFNGQGRT